MRVAIVPATGSIATSWSGGLARSTVIQNCARAASKTTLPVTVPSFTCTRVPLPELGMSEMAPSCWSETPTTLCTGSQATPSGARPVTTREISASVVLSMMTS